MTALRIGLLAPTSAQQQVLEGLINTCGYRVGARLDSLAAGQSSGTVDAWIVGAEDLLDTTADPDTLEQWLDRLTVPAIVCDEKIPAPHASDYHAWQRRLAVKLQQLAGEINLTTDKRARQVWVLAASTGGPKAVQTFINRLPPALGIGFIYVQHIDREFNQSLIQAVNQNGHYPAAIVQHGDVLRANRVAIVPTDRTTTITDSGTFVVRESPWAAPYSPSVDAVVANVSSVYGRHSGVVIFTGMGDDGTMSSRLMRRHGGRVWVQSPESCAVDAMPASVLNTGEVDFQGTPIELATRLAALSKPAGPFKGSLVKTALQR